jgi:hypothetical protein
VLVLLGMAGVFGGRGEASAAGIVGPPSSPDDRVTIHPLLALQRHHLPGWLAVTLTMLVTYTALRRWRRARGGAAGHAAPHPQPQFMTSSTDTDWLGEMGVSSRSTPRPSARPQQAGGVRSSAHRGRRDRLGLGHLVLLFFLIIDSSAPQRLARRRHGGFGGGLFAAPRSSSWSPPSSG